MEALPRLPMISFDLLTTSEKTQFSQKLKPYIASFYQEDPESYNNEIRTLEGLRATAVWPSIDVNSCQIMKKYYCQLHFLKSRFPMEEGPMTSMVFGWKDEYTKMSCSIPDINFELMCMLINIGCIHAKLGAEDSRTSPEGMKISCTHFQCAAWAFQTVREIYGHHISLIMISSEQIRGMQLICLAQAQECILEKSLLDSRKASIIAKIAVQLCDYYRQAWISFQTGDESLVLDHLPNHKYVAQYLQFKIAYHRCISLLYQGQQAEEQQKMGERVAFYQAAVDTLEESIKQASKMSSSSLSLFKDTIAFTLDVVKGKHKAAVNENEFIYHEDVPQLASLQEIKGASLVKGIPFSIHDEEVSGKDIFGRLVPMEAHEASSLYSERKAQMLRNVGERVEKKDIDLCDFLNSMQLEVLGFVKQSKGLPQDLVDRAASMVAKPNATRDLIESMGKLSNTYQEVESMLKEIQELLQIEEDSEKEYQGIMGKRPPSIIATDLAREAAKYQEAHGKASESNLNLHKAMTTHVANIKLLAQPLGQLVQIVPTLQMPDPNVDEKSLEQMEALLAKVDEMKNQRMMLWSQLRDAVHQDDITGTIVTKENDQPLDVVFQQALDKHAKITALIDHNLMAQENICKALVEAYAKFTPTRKYLQDLYHRRNTTLSALISSHDTYDDLLLKANKGIEFYAKLETNVGKLLGRIKGACNVQQEERDQMLIQNGHTKQHVHVDDDIPQMQTVAPTIVEVNPPPTTPKPKLKDYLDSMKEKRESISIIGPQMQYPASSLYPAQQHQGQGQTQDTWNEYTYGKSTTTNLNNYQGNYTEKNVNQDLINKMNALKIPVPHTNYDNNAQGQGYSYNNYVAANSGTGAMAYTNTVGATPGPVSAVGTAGTQPVTVNVNYTDYMNNAGYTGHNYTANTLNTDNAGTSSANYTTPTQPQQQPVQQYQDQAYYNNYEMPVNRPSSAPNPNPQSSYYYQQPQQPQQQIEPVPVNQYYQYYTNTDSNQYSYPIPGTNTNTLTNSIATNPNQSIPTTSTTVNPANYAVAQFPYTPGTQVSQQSQPPNYVHTTTNPTSYTPTAVYQPAPTPTPPPAVQNVSPYGQTGNYYSATYDYPSAGTVQDAYMSNAYQYPTPLPIASTPSNSGVNYMYTQQQPTMNVNVNDIYTSSYPAAAAQPQGQTLSYYNNQYTNGVGVYDYAQSGVYQAPGATNINTNAAYQSYPATNVGVGTSTSIASLNNVETNTQITIQAKKESSIDLLAGLDFSINQAPLVPLKNENKEKPAEVIEILPPKQIDSDYTTGTTNATTNTNGAVKYPKKKDKVLLKGDPFNNPDIVKQFLVEVDKFEKYVEGLAVKTLNGPSNLETRWKELQECQENMETCKKSISVARCYPLKNRSPDILPYDYSRVALVDAKDDYINASHVTLGSYCMDFIITQQPLQQTVEEFWNMVWEQQVETIVCLLSDNEINEGCYWPSEPGKDLNVTRRVILAHCSGNEHWTERKLTISDEKESRLINIFQYTGWPGSLFPTNVAPYIDFLKLIIKSYERQKCTGAPVLVHCMAGVGRTGICCTLLAALMELAAVACPLPDVPAIAAKISTARKNVLRDREHFKFVYTTLLQHVQQIRKEHTRSDNEKAETVSMDKEATVVDPLSALDPLWATRKS